MGNKKQRIIPAHYSWNSSIITRGIIDPIKRKLGWVDENEHPVSLKESATGQELDRIKDTAKDAGKLVATGLAFSNPVTSSTAMAPLITGSQAYFMSEGLKDAYDRVASSNKTAADGAMVALDIAGAVPAVSAAVNGAKYVLPTVAKTVTPVLITKQISKTKLPIVEPTLNIGWGPKQTLKVARAGEYDQMYFPKRWDVVNESANPHGVWLQGKYGTPRTETTNPGKGIKAAKARNIFSTRPDKYTGAVILDKPIVTVGEVPNRSALSYQADNMGADGLIYNGVYDNGYNNNQVILSFRRPELTKIQLSEAELKGVPKSVRNFVPSDNEPFRKQLIDTYNGWIKQFNQPIADQNKWAQEYADYWNSVGVETSPPFASEIPYESIPDNATISEAKRIIENTMRRHNQFYRGVTKPVLNEDISLVKGLSDEEALIQATQPRRPGDGVWITPASNAFIYGSNGKTALLRRPYKLGKNPMNWIKEGDFKIRGYRPEESTAYGIPKPNTVYDPWHTPDNPAQGYLNELWSTQPLKFIEWRESPNVEETSLNWMTFKQGGILKRVESGKSGIYIKPENRGKLTRLKKRTGKSEAELWKEGDPAVRKMITFARNARKWKH